MVSQEKRDPLRKAGLPADHSAIKPKKEIQARFGEVNFIYESVGNEKGANCFVSSAFNPGGAKLSQNKTNQQKKMGEKRE